MLKSSVKTYQLSADSTAKRSELWADIGMLTKFRLSSLVVITSLGAYVIATGSDVSLLPVIVLLLGGFMVTAASNIMNQVLEKDYDILMDRTSMRPLPNDRIQSSHAVLIAGLLCLAGVTLLGFFNTLTAFFGMLAFVVYAFVYTPLKRHSRIAVSVGAIAGAMPMLIGVVAAEGSITMLALVLFSIQFAWQYPHFWSIAFLCNEDYRKAGFKFVPYNSNNQVERSIALSGLVYSILLIATSYLLYAYDLLGVYMVIAYLLLSVFFGYKALIFYKNFDKSSAKHVMFTSLAYIPLVLVIFIVQNIL